MQQLEDKTQVKKLYIAAALAVITVVFILFGFGAGLLCNFVGFVYPAFASFKALDSKNEGEERNWLIYWVVYSCFCLVFLPQTQGAKKLYEDVLSKALKPYVA